MLAGESPGRIKTPTQRTGQPTYDARELRRWKIDEGRLPPASVVLFREPTIWRRDPRAITLGALLGGIPVVAIVLLVGLIKRRRAESRGPVGEGRSHAGTCGCDGQGVDRGRRWPARGRRPVLPAPRSTTRGRPSCIPMTSSDAARSTVVRSSRREPFQMEYRVREAGGVERWILDTGLPRFSGKDFDGYVGSAVDITRLGRARAELSNLSRHLMQAHERERAALAKTLHEDVCQRMVALTLRLHNLQGAAHDGEVKPSSPISARNWQAWSARSPRCRTRSISGSSCWV